MPAPLRRSVGGRLGRRGVAGERLVPEAVEVGPQPGDAVRLDPVQPPRPLPALAYEPGVLEDAKVLRHGRPADRKARGELAHGEGPTAEPLEDPAPGRVAECI